MTFTGWEAFFFPFKSVAVLFRVLGDIIISGTERTSSTTCDTNEITSITASESEMIQKWSKRMTMISYHYEPFVVSDRLHFSFMWIQIAKMLGISRMTLYRRQVAFGMMDRQAIQVEKLIEI